MLSARGRRYISIVGDWTWPHGGVSLRALKRCGALGSSSGAACPYGGSCVANPLSVLGLDKREVYVRLCTKTYLRRKRNEKRQRNRIGALRSGALRLDKHFARGRIY